LFWKYGEFGPWFISQKKKKKIEKKNPLNGSKSILFYLVVKVVKSQKKPCSQFECLFGHFPQFEVFKTNNFIWNLARFYKRREHPSKGVKERNNVQSRREEMAKMTLPWRPCPSTYQCTCVDSTLVIPIPIMAHIPKALTMFGLCRGEEICSNWRKSHEVLYFEDLLQMTCMLGLGIQVFFFLGLGPKHF
jgi:hypothetical protein